MVNFYSAHTGWTLLVPENSMYPEVVKSTIQQGIDLKYSDKAMGTWAGQWPQVELSKTRNPALFNRQYRLNTIYTWLPLVVKRFVGGGEVINTLDGLPHTMC